jgi:uncharacterized Zn-binding protein involved in type VI secretion
MSDVSGSASVGTSATLIVTGPSVSTLSDNFPAVLSNLGDTTVYIGSSSVTAGNGAAIRPGETLAIGNLVNDSVYGVVTAGSCSVGYACFASS